MLIGGLEGLPHEKKYIDEPRESLPEFTFLSNPVCVTGTDSFLTWNNTGGEWRRGCRGL